MLSMRVKSKLINSTPHDDDTESATEEEKKQISKTESKLIFESATSNVAIRCRLNAAPRNFIDSQTLVLH